MDFDCHCDGCGYVFIMVGHDVNGGEIDYTCPICGEPTHNVQHKQEPKKIELQGWNVRGKHGKGR